MADEHRTSNSIADDLRHYATYHMGAGQERCFKACDEIERLTARVAELEASIANCTGELGCKAYALAGAADETSHVHNFTYRGGQLFMCDCGAEAKEYR